MLQSNVGHRFERRFLLAIGIMISSGIAAPVTAAQVTIVNNGFEDISGETPSNAFTFGPFNGWDLYDPGSIAGSAEGPTFFMGTLTPVEPDPVGNPGVYSFFPDGAPEGQRIAIAFDFVAGAGQGEWGLIQTLSATLEPATRYVLSVRIGDIASGVSTGGTFFLLDGFPGYRVDLLAGGTVVAQDNNLLASGISDGEFLESTVEFITGEAHPQLGQPLAIRLVNLNQVDPTSPGSDLEVDFDDVRLDASPAPSAVTSTSVPALVLLLLGLGGVGMLRWTTTKRA